MQIGANLRPVRFFKIVLDRLPPNVVPLLAMWGLVAYIVLNELLLWRANRGVHLHSWAAAWATLALTFISARILQRGVPDPGVAAAATRVMFACAFMIGPIAAGALRAAWKLPARPTLHRALMGACLACVAVTLFTPYVVTSEAYLRTDITGVSYYALRPGTLNALLVGPYIVGVAAYLIRIVRREQQAQGVYRTTWFLLVVALVGTATNDALMAAGVYKSVHLLEYGYSLVTIAVSYLGMRRMDSGYASLEDAVEERTSKIVENEHRLERALDDLRTSEARFRQLASSTLEGIVVHDQGRIVDVNVAFARMLRLSGREIIGRNVLDMFDEASNDKIAPLLTARSERAEAELRRHDDSQVAVEVVGSRSRIGGNEVAVLAVQDLSERKKMQAQLMQSDRLASVGTLAAGTAHEINNPLAYVSANLVFAAEQLEDVSKQHPDERLSDCISLVGEARDGCDRIRRIVDDLKSLSRSDDSDFGPTDVCDALEKAIQIAGNEIRHRAMLDRDYRSTGAIDTSNARLGQVFINILINAAHAIHEGRADDNKISVTVETVPGRGVAVEISDTGVGISPADLPRIFDPFVTTKAVGKGTGLGLSIAHGIVTSLGGTIAVDSEVDRGTTFRIVLPTVDYADVQAPEPASSGEIRIRTGKILIVDDEPLVARAIKRALGRHDTVVANSGRAALEHLEQTQFDIVLCDLMMPDMTGMEVFAAVEDRWPEMTKRIVFVTGGAFTDAARNFLASIPNLAIEKPVNINELRALVDSLVARWAA